MTFDSKVADNQLNGNYALTPTVRVASVVLTLAGCCRVITKPL